jgi:hypothetical protein
MVALVVLALALSFAVWLGYREPSYKAKGLSTWVNEYYKSTDRQPTNEAALAIQNFGSNAVPYLLRLAARPPDSRFKKKVVQQLNNKRRLLRVFGLERWFDSYATAEFNDPLKAKLCLGLLGNDERKSAIPGLIGIMRTSKNPNGPTMAIDTFAEMGPAGEAVLPELLQNLKGRDRRIRTATLAAIGTIGYRANHWRPECAQRIFPTLLKMLDDPQIDVVWILRLLNDPVFKPGAEQLRPKLVCYADHSDPEVRSAATLALGHLNSDENVR